MAYRHFTLNGGQIRQESNTYQLTIPPTADGYTDAQIDDYGMVKNGRSHFQWHPNSTLQLSAKFSHPVDQLIGTAGFGFWNAPFGDPTVKWPKLPQAVWFFFGSPPNDLPFIANSHGHGWVASTVNALSWRALRWAPLTPLVLALNNVPAIQQRLWPKVEADLGIASRDITAVSTNWHTYKLHWGKTSSKFWIDEQLILETTSSPKGPLGFVCWIDNQYMVVRENGRFNWGILPTPQPQTLQIKHLSITPNIKI